MERRFPEQSWVDGLLETINSDSDYERVASKWEGDLLFIIEPDETLDELTVIYLDLWHGKCRETGYFDRPPERKTAYRFRGPYSNFARILVGQWPPMQALLTRKLQVKGSMTYLARNLPTVLEFVRCCQKNTTSILGEEPRELDSTDPKS
jgi:putative sterol carrier protein